MGSAHCISMCGGLVAASARTRFEWLAYQLGRLLGYALLGAFAGFWGSKLFREAHESSLNILAWFSTAIMALLFILAGWRLWRGRGVHFSLIPNRMVHWLFKLGGRNPSLAGLFTAFLPCGWLHGFALGAAATRSALSGALFLFVFWIGTLPALGLAPWVLKKILKPLSFRSPKIAGLILVAGGFYSIGVKIWPYAHAAKEKGIETYEEMRCH